MSDLNIFIGQGRLTRDAELKYTKASKPVLKGCIANTTGYGDYEKTHFIDFTIWGPSTEKLVQYLTKGKQIIIKGELHSNSWTTDDGQKRKTWFINHAQINFTADGKSFVAKDGPDTAGSPDEDDIPF